MIWLLDAKGQNLFIDADLASAIELAPIECEGNGWFQLVHPDDRDAVAQMIGLACKEQRPFTLRYRLRFADSAYHWVSIGAMPSFGPPSRSFLGFCGSLSKLCSDSVDVPITAYGSVGEFTPSPPTPSRDGACDQLAADALLMARSHAQGQEMTAVRQAIDIALYIVASNLNGCDQERVRLQ